jgi:2-iminoacetate synthase ThiH
MQGIGLSQVALDWGCDDLDGTVVWYDITKSAGNGVHQEMHVEQLPSARSRIKPPRCSRLPFAGEGNLKTKI